jgi:hypothetical protein
MKGIKIDISELQTMLIDLKCGSSLDIDKDRRSTNIRSML